MYITLDQLMLIGSYTVGIIGLVNTYNRVSEAKEQKNSETHFDRVPIVNDR